MGIVLLAVDTAVEWVDAVVDKLLLWLRFDWVSFDWIHQLEWKPHYAPIAVVLMFFWPVVLSLIMTVTTASTWLFWLLTSIVFGIVQLGYVTYQFLAISGDIMLLSLLKSYSMMRRQLLFYLGKSGLRERSSRRRVWQSNVDKAESYYEYLAIGIEPKLVKQTSSVRRDSFRCATSTPPASAASSPTRGLSRSSSFGNIESPTRSIGGGLTRTKSFAGRMSPLLAEDDGIEIDPIIQQELGMTGEMLIATTTRLREARHQATTEATEDAMSSLKHLLSGVVKRNHLAVDDILVENGRSVAESGVYGLSHVSRNVIRAYQEEVNKCLGWIADSPLESATSGPSTPQLETIEPPKSDTSEGVFRRRDELSDRIMLVRKMKQNMGRTALMLSGGGAQAMYHLGSVRALIQSELYDDIKVISGTSGGSISAAMCAIKTSEELLRNVCVSNVSTDYMSNGRMKKENIRWFPSITEMGAYWVKNKLLVDSREFKRCCDFYYGDITFEEAFERTGKHVCITVSASRATGGTAQRLLLNHISTPHVTLSSAVAASCALPGVMAPAKLLCKDSNGRQEPFEVDGVDWIDGSVQADLPFQRISTLFNVSNFVVCQTNFHVVPLLNKYYHPSQGSLYWRLFQTIEWDVRNRALNLSRLGLFPRIFGQDISKMFKQKYHGNLTLVPRFTAMQTVGLKALANPTVQDMEGYLKYGQSAAWPYLSVIRDMVRFERVLDECLARLESRSRFLNPEMDWSHHDGDDLDSIASSSIPTSSQRLRFIRPETHREAERLKQKVLNLERENMSLKHHLEEVQSLLKEKGIDDPISSSTEEAGTKEMNGSGQNGSDVLDEGKVWSLLRRQRR